MTDENLPNNKTTGQPDNLDIIQEPVHPTRATRYMNKVVIFALVLIAVSLGVFLKWSFESQEVLYIKNSPFPARIINDPTGKTGGIIFLNAEYCKYQNKTGELRMSYVSKSREVFLPIAKEQMEVGCSKREEPVVIPLNLVKDNYKIKFRVTYDINPLKRNVTTNFESQTVTVGNNGPQ